MSNDYSAFIGHNRPDEILEINKLAEAQRAAQEKVDKLAIQLSEAEEELRQIAEVKLPEAMDIAGLSEFKTDTGIHVEVEEKIRGGLTVENRPAGYSWLRENGYGAMIEGEVVSPYKRNEVEAALALVEELRTKGRIALLKETVHHSRLDKFIREKLEEGKDIPLDIFSVHRQRVAKVEV